MSGRRDFLTTTAALAATTVLLPPSAKAEAPHPDAELLRICAQHIVNLRAFNASTVDAEEDDDPLWTAYTRTRDAIGGAKPCTLDGMLAKARAAKAEARSPAGIDDPEGTPGEQWAWDLVNDLLAGSAGA